MRIVTPSPQRTRILAMNQGSSTLKAALYEVRRGEELLLSVAIDEPRDAKGEVKIADSHGKTIFQSKVKRSPPDTALDLTFRFLAEHGYTSDLAAVGHRLVHGGPRYNQPERITGKVLKELERLIPLDPEHLPQAIRDIRFVTKKFPHLPQVACFDTAFHSSLPQIARIYALPRKLYSDGIRRYGFHGLSYEYIMEELTTRDAELADRRVIIAHLGNGASMTAVYRGKSMDTSMGLTPLEGLVMGTRSGDVDPGALIYLQAEKKFSPKTLDRLLNKESGLLGVSGLSGDMRELVHKSSTYARAA